MQHGQSYPSVFSNLGTSTVKSPTKSGKQSGAASSSSSFDPAALFSKPNDVHASSMLVKTHPGEKLNLTPARRVASSAPKAASLSRSQLLRAASELARSRAASLYPANQAAKSDEFDGVKDWLIETIPQVCHAFVASFYNSLQILILTHLPCAQPDVLGSSDNSENDRQFFQLVHNVLERKGQVPLDQPSALITTLVPLHTWNSDSSLRVVFLRNLAALLRVEREQIKVASVRDGGYGALLTVWFKLCELCIVAPSVAMSNLRVAAASGQLYHQPHLPIKSVSFRPAAKFVKIQPSLVKLDRQLKIKAKVQAFRDVLRIRKMKLRLQALSDGIIADNKELLLLDRLIKNQGHSKELVRDYNAWFKRVAVQVKEVKDIKAVIKDVDKHTRLARAAAIAKYGLAELKASKLDAAVKKASLKVGEKVAAQAKVDLQVASLLRHELLKATEDDEEQLNRISGIGSSSGSHSRSHSSSSSGGGGGSSSSRSGSGSGGSSNHRSSSSRHNGASDSASNAHSAAIQGDSISGSSSSKSSIKGIGALKKLDDQVHRLQAVLAEIQ
jgi:hypothetical protein